MAFEHSTLWPYLFIIVILAMIEANMLASVSSILVNTVMLLSAFHKPQIIKHSQALFNIVANMLASICITMVKLGLNLLLASNLLTMPLNLSVSIICGSALLFASVL